MTPHDLRFPIRVFVLPAVLCLGACAPRAAEVVPAIEVLQPNDRVSLEATAASTQKPSRSTERIRLASAVNETVSFQLVLRSPIVSCGGVEISAEDFVLEAGGSSASQSVMTTWEMPKTEMFRAWPITVERYPNWYLRLVGPRQARRFFDALIPVTAPYHGQPYTITPGEPLVLWGDVCIPSQSRPGSYRASVLIRGPWKFLMRVPIELTVYDVYLHPRDLLPVLTNVTLGPLIAAHGKSDPRNLRTALMDDDDARRAIRSAMEQLHRHGLSPFTREVYPRLSQEVDGRVLVDWSDYDAFCGPLIDGTAYADRRRSAGWPLPVDLQQPRPVEYDGMESAAYAHVLKEYFTAARLHFAERGWSEGTWVEFDLARGMNPTREELAQFKLVHGLLREVSGPLTQPTTSRESISPTTRRTDEWPRLLSTLIPQSMTPFGWKDHRYEDVSALIDVWATPARYFHRQTMAAQRSLGKRTWLPPDVPPFGASLAVEAPTTQARAWAWQGYLAEVDGLFLEQATQWPARPFEETIRARHTRSDTWLLYPGDLFGLREPVASVRLKQLRAGLHDVQLLRLLEAHGRRETAQLLGRSLIKSFGTEACGDHFLDGVMGRWVNDGGLWQLARDLLLEEAAAAVNENGQGLPNREENRANWSKFLSATRGIEVTAESARVSVVNREPLDETSGQKRRFITVTHDVAVRSELRTPVQGELRLGPLPAGGRAVRGAVAFGPLDEMEMARRPLVWELEGPLPSDLDGHFVQRVIADAGRQGETHCDATLSIVQAPRVTRPIRVDGDLSDWTPAESNAAGDFRLLTFASPSDFASGTFVQYPGAAHRPRGEFPTVAFFCRDEDFLYVGLHAASPGTPESGEQTMTSEVEYEDMTPVGEDLVELLIDPTNAATTMDDVFHIVIKSNGIGLFEKGIGLKPAVGMRSAWPGQLPRHAVSRMSYGWSAEIGIPIQALGRAGGRGVWGMNIARNEPVRGEYSDWARAPRNCYDPRALGNLLLHD